MNADLLYKARLRKGSYLVAVLLLFSFSLLWRGVIPLPFANAAAASERERKGEPQPFADRMAASTLLSQADRLELRELDQGDPDVATSAAQYALVGIRGPIVTGLWWAAIEKQKRNEWQEFQQLIELVTHLQPNFITPWIFQSWNIAYNVSVENEKLSDMYYYISQGINLLAKGDRVNTKTYRARGQEPIEVELHLDKPDPSQVRMNLSVVFKPVEGYQPTSPRIWRTRCETLFATLRRYL